MKKRNTCVICGQSIDDLGGYITTCARCKAPTYGDAVKAQVEAAAAYRILENMMPKKEDKPFSNCDGWWTEPKQCVEEVDADEAVKPNDKRKPSKSVAPKMKNGKSELQDALDILDDVVSKRRRNRTNKDIVLEDIVQKTPKIYAVEEAVEYQPKEKEWSEESENEYKQPRRPKKAQRKVVEITAKSACDIFYTTSDGTRVKIFDAETAKTIEAGGGVTITKNGKHDDDSGII